MFWLVALTTAHPRVSGENDAAYTNRAIAAGSSPRERGKPADPNATRLVPRLIPA